MCRHNGTVAGSKNSEGYRYIGFKESGKRRNVRVHHIIWYLCEGEWPGQQIDHIDRNPRNNRIDNLRLATNAQNIYNITAHNDNQLGEKGICWVPSRKRYQVQISIGGRNTMIGRYQTLDEARCARDAAYHQHHGEFARVA